MENIGIRGMKIECSSREKDLLIALLYRDGGCAIIAEYGLCPYVNGKNCMDCFANNIKWETDRSKRNGKQEY